MVYRYPPEVHEFVKRWATELRDEELAKTCNRELGTHFSASSMKAFRGNYGYRNMKGRWTSEEYWKYQKKWPQGMFEFIRDNSWGVSSKEMAEMVNEKFGTNFSQQRMKSFRAKYKIRSGLTGWYQKGHVPGNKGKKLEEYVKDKEKLEDIRKRISATQFKKGNRPVNELPVGTVVVNSDGYKLRKRKAEGTLWERWEHLHRAVWEEHNGPIPEGMMVSFKDSNKLNCNIDNLMLITRGENSQLTMRGYRSEDPDLTMAGLAVVRVRNAIKERRNK